jgi:uncharacterized protein YdaU (DUF1376 family)
MGKQPYIPLYMGDWIQDTDCLSIAAEGAWLRIVFKCWKNNGMFSATMDVFARVCKVSTPEFASILLEWETNNICDIIKGDNGIITVLSRRIRRDKEISASKSENGSKGGSKTQANRKANNQAKAEQKPEYDNEIENATEDNLNKKESAQKVEDSLFSDEIFVEKLRSAHREKDLRQAFRECYIHHSNGPNPPKELWQWRQKLNTWLTIKPAERKNSKQPKKKLTLDDLKQ